MKNTLFILPILFALFSCSDPTIPGCTDKEALNYNSEANTDDGTCKFELDIAYDFVKSNLKDPYSAEFVAGGSWELPSFQSKYPCINVKYLDVRAKNSYGAFGLQRYYVSFQDNEVIPELIANDNQSDSDIGFLLELTCTMHKVDCSRHKINSSETKEIVDEKLNTPKEDVVTDSDASVDEIPTQEGLVNVSNLNFRSSPEITNNIIGRLDKGDKVIILDKLSGVLDENIKGLLTNSISVAIDGVITKINKGKSLNILNQDGDSIICEVDLGKSDLSEIVVSSKDVEILNNEAWVKIQNNETIGFVYARFIDE